MSSRLRREESGRLWKVITFHWINIWHHIKYYNMYFIYYVFTSLNVIQKTLFFNNRIYLSIIYLSLVCLTSRFSVLYPLDPARWVFSLSDFFLIHSLFLTLSQNKNKSIWLKAVLKGGQSTAPVLPIQRLGTLLIRKRRKFKATQI